ncbi:hypothetical protein CPB84DRAFT_1750426 [Gymnopilus junonius]|uniref:Uncharacterized protein n=1 Tax=Gymnopilus junonius TaxID=109634 RepID=A0A9P5TIE5_GYMJU|nr:hypothetical protein CPB84DRAFT_1750426 [Gymnopilus junonius]
MPPYTRKMTKTRKILVSVISYLNDCALDHLRSCYAMRCNKSWTQEQQKVHMATAKTLIENIQRLIYEFGEGDVTLFDCLDPAIIQAYVAFMSAPSGASGLVPELADAFWRPFLWKSERHKDTDPMNTPPEEN